MNSTPRPLSDRIALVTGASRGIGAAIATRLAADGAKIIAHYGSGEAETKQLVAKIEAAGGRATAVQADLSTTKGPFELMDRVAEHLGTGRLDILVNNAGSAPFAATAEMTSASFDEMAAINMRSVFFVTQRALPLLADGGNIVNLSSLVTRTTFPGVPAYSATKGFVDVLTLHWAQEFAPRRIRVNAVAPGAIDTRMSAWMHGPGGAETLKAIQALPGFGQPEHIAAVVAFLVGPDGAWTTGQVIDASGGTKL
ncbi:MAG: SDR family oxidoreductase [Deltaproteobacteria bacterium]|nr:SDR family oxidoreductase [Nannocystaceae bacterium]